MNRSARIFALCIFSLCANRIHAQTNSPSGDCNLIINGNNNSDNVVYCPHLKKDGETEGDPKERYYELKNTFYSKFLKVKQVYSEDGKTVTYTDVGPVVYVSTEGNEYISSATMASTAEEFYYLFHEKYPILAEEVITKWHGRAIVFGGSGKSGASILGNSNIFVFACAADRREFYADFSRSWEPHSPKLDWGTIASVGLTNRYGHTRVLHPTREIARFVVGISENEPFESLLNPLDLFENRDGYSSLSLYVENRFTSVIGVGDALPLGVDGLYVETAQIETVLHEYVAKCPN